MERGVKGEEAKELLAFLQRMDEGYCPTKEERKNLRTITFLDCSFMGLISLPASIGDLKSLEQLDVRGNELTELPECLGELKSLKQLYVIGNELTELPECLGDLKSLNQLYVSENKLTELRECLGDLKSLKQLDVCDNELTELPECLGDLKSLKQLYVSGNKLTELPECLGELKSLEQLGVWDNQLTELPEWIGDLKSLEQLYVGGNKLTELPECLGELQSLEQLVVWGNQLTELPECLGELKSLELLDVSFNQLTELPEWLGHMSQLKRLDISHMHFHHLPAQIMQLGLEFSFSDFLYENGINLQDTTIAAQPISLFMQPRELIQAYYDAPKVPVNEGKVIFLGEGDVGKSYTIERILNHDEKGNYDTSMTPGISIKTHSVIDEEGKRFDIRFWDFGGQEIMHAMHRCFLTQRTCYVVMVSNRLKDINAQARYWLRNIESFAPGSEVLLVVNRWDNYPYGDDLDYRKLQQLYPNLVGQVVVSAKCDDKETFHYLTKRIVQMAARLDSTGMDFPIQWDAIRQALTNKAKEKIYYINQNDYYQICQDNGLVDENIRTWLLEWFNDLGTCFSYHQDTDKKTLKEYKVLNPEWLTNAIYLIILNGRFFADKGIIKREGIEQLLAHPIGGTMTGVSYSPEQCGYVLEVMRKFNLSFSVSKEQEFIPALCPNLTPGELHPKTYQQHIKYQLEYIYLPDSVVHQLMIHCFQRLNLSKCWRKGMKIEIPDMGLTAVADMEGTDEYLTIDVYSNSSIPLWQLLQPLLDAIETINAKLNLKAKHYVYAEEDGCVERFSIEHIFSVKKGSAKRRPRDYVQGKEIDFSIPRLFNMIYGLEQIEQEDSPVSRGRMDHAQLSQELFAHATLQHCSINILQGNNRISVNQGFSSDEMKDILLQMIEATEENQLAFAKMLADHTTGEAKSLGTEMVQAQKERKSMAAFLRDRLDDTDKLTAIGSALWESREAIHRIAQKLPDIWQILQNMIP